METFLEVAADLLARGDIQEAFVDSARFLYVYNSTTLVASVGAIVGLVLLGSLLWIAISASVKDDKFGGNSYYGNGYRRGRSTYDGREEPEQSFAEQLYSIYEAFKKYDIMGSECQKRAICEAYLPQEEKEVLRFASLVQSTIRKMKKESPASLDIEAFEFLENFSEAADQGRLKQSCSAYRAKCPVGLPDFVRRTQTN